MEKKKLDKATKIASILSVVLVMILMISISFTKKEDETDAEILEMNSYTTEYETIEKESLTMEEFEEETFSDKTVEVVEATTEFVIEETTQASEQVVYNTNYAPADENKDGVVTQQEEHDYMSPAKQACLDAGVGVVVAFRGGEYYMVVTPIDGRSKGMDGMIILRNHIESMGLDGYIGSDSSDENYIWYKATNIHVPITQEDPDFWN